VEEPGVTQMMTAIRDFMASTIPTQARPASEL
jgi:hypothetical protein